MKLAQVLILCLLLAATANAATTNLSSHTVTTTHILADGRASIGTTANLTSYQLFVTNESRFVRASLNDSLTVGGAAIMQATSWHEGPATFNSTVNFVDGSITRADLPSTIAYEDEANTFSVRQVYSDGFTAGANAYHEALTQMNSTTLVQWLYAAGVVDVNGTFIASTNSYHEGLSQFNLSVNSVRANTVDSAYFARTSADTDARWVIQADGAMFWGPGGTSAQDTNLSRCFASVLCSGDAYRVVNDGAPGSNNGLLVTTQYQSGWNDGLHMGDRGSGQAKFVQSYGGDLQLNPTGNLVTTGADFRATTEVTARQGAAEQVRLGNRGPSGQAAICFHSSEDVCFFRSEADYISLQGGDNLFSPFYATSGTAATARKVSLVNSAGAAVWVSSDDIALDGASLVDLKIGGTRYLRVTSSETEIDGDLNHDGSNVGLYGKAPVAQAADIVQVTDNTGGTVSSTCAAIAAGALYSQADLTAVKNCLASLIAKINALDTVVDNIGMTA